MSLSSTLMACRQCERPLGDDLPRLNIVHRIHHVQGYIMWLHIIWSVLQVNVCRRVIRTWLMTSDGLIYFHWKCNISGDGAWSRKTLPATWFSVYACGCVTMAKQILPWRSRWKSRCPYLTLGCIMAPREDWHIFMWKRKYCCMWYVCPEGA